MPRETGAFFIYCEKEANMNKNEIVLFETADNEVSLNVQKEA